MIDGSFFLDCRDDRNACDCVYRWRWFHFIFAVVDMIAEEILIMQEEIKLLRAAVADAGRFLQVGAVMSEVERQKARRCLVRNVLTVAMRFCRRLG